MKRKSRKWCISDGCATFYKLGRYGNLIEETPKTKSANGYLIPSTNVLYGRQSKAHDDLLIIEAMIAIGLTVEELIVKSKGGKVIVEYKKAEDFLSFLFH